CTLVYLFDCKSAKYPKHLVSVRSFICSTANQPSTRNISSVYARLSVRLQISQVPETSRQCTLVYLLDCKSAKYPKHLVSVRSFICSTANQPSTRNISSVYARLSVRLQISQVPETSRQCTLVYLLDCKSAKYPKHLVSVRSFICSTTINHV
ncbi:hypothetical protein J6590_059207, partial [Homalodisca vitripennis]